MLDVDTELDILLGGIDDAYWEAHDSDVPKKGRRKIDLILSQVTEDLSVTVLLGFFTFTAPHKEEFKYRQRILDMVKRKEPNRPELWKGLE